MKIHILMTGLRGDCQGYPEAAFKTKKALREFMRKEFPEARGTNRMEPNELYWEDEHGGWARCDTQIELVE